MPVKDRDKELNPAEKRYGQGSHDDLGVHPERREAEVDDLEKLYNAESAPENQTQTKQQEAESKSIDKASEPASNWETKTDGKKKRRFNINRRRAAIGGGAAGLFIGTGMGFFGFIAGPLQFIHFAQVLRGFHMDNVDDFTDGRTGKLMRYATKGITGSTTQDRNLGAFGNRIAVHYENKLRSRGMDFEYGPSGRLSRVVVDTNTPEGRRLIADIETDSGVDLSSRPPPDGKIPIDLASESGGISTAKMRRSFIKMSVKASGLNRVSGSLASRMLKARAAVDFHPLKNIARSADENFRLRYDEYRQRRTDQVRDGTQPDARSNLDGTEGADEATSDSDKAKAQELDGKAGEVAELSRADADFNTRVANVKGALGTGVGVTAAAGLICGLDAIGDETGKLMENNVIKPLIRTGGDALTVGSQVMTGQDVNFEALGALSQSFYDHKEKTSWVEAKSILAEQGREGGKEIPPTARPTTDRPGFFGIIDDIVGIPGLNQFCDAVNTTIGGIAMSVVGVVAGATGPWSLALGAISEGTQEVLANQLAPHLVRWLAGEAVDIANFAGADYGSISNYGVFLAANNTMKGLGGKALSLAERISLDNARQERQRQEMSTKSFYARMFEPTEPNSLFASTVLGSPSFQTTSTTIASATSYPTNFLSNIGNSLRSILPGATAQVQPFDYGVDEFGFSLDEINSEALEDPYKNAEFVEDNLASLNSTYGEECFGTTIDPSSKAITYSEAPTYLELEDRKGTCTSDDADRYRMYLADMITMKSLTCYEGLDDTACSELGISNDQDTVGSNDSGASSVAGEGVVGNPNESSVDIACAPNTVDVGVHAAYSQGNPVQHRLCAITNLPSTSSESSPGSSYYIEGANGSVLVNSRISGAVFKMVNDAQTAGITLSAASSFRTMAHQQALFSRNPDPRAVARPGGSAHQSGTAIDFSNMGSKGGSSEDCSNRKRADGDPRWVWLFQNAERYGLKQYSYEPWHWDTLPLANRCGSNQP